MEPECITALLVASCYQEVSERLMPGKMFPPIPAGGFESEQEIARLPGARRIDVVNAIAGPSPDLYAFYRATTQRNLYRIPLP